MGGFQNVRIFHNGVHVNPNSLRKPTPIIKTIHITLDDAFNGIQYPLKIERWIIEENNTKRVEAETIYIPIPKGIDNNEIIVVKEKGNIISDELKGNIKVFIKIKSHDIFERRGIDLIFKKDISLKESLCGFKFNIQYFNNRGFTIDNNNGKIIKPNTQKVVQGMGLTRDNMKGNLVIIFNIIYPDSITDVQRKAIRDIL